MTPTNSPDGLSHRPITMCPAGSHAIFIKKRIGCPSYTHSLDNVTGVLEKTVDAGEQRTDTDKGQN